MIASFHLGMHYDCFILFSCSLQGNGLCDRRTRPCRKVTVLGTGFIPSENMTCHLEEVRVRVYNEFKKGKWIKFLDPLTFKISVIYIT